MIATIAIYVLNALAAVAISAVVMMIMGTKTKTPTRSPDQIDNSTFPETRDKPIAEVFGRVKIRSGNTAWHGRHRVIELVNKSKGARKYLLFGPKKTIKTPAGFKYFTSVQFMLCHGPVTLHKIYDNEKVIFRTPCSDITRSWFGISNYTGLPYNEFDPDSAQDPVTTFRYIGDIKNLGGRLTKTGFDDSYVYGELDFYPGTEEQTASPKMISFLNEPDFPRYKGISYIVFDNMCIGRSPSLSPIFVEVSRYPPSPKGFSQHENVNDDANPAYVLYELATNKRFANMEAFRIDVDSFEKVAKICYDEGLGVSFSWETPGEYEKIKSEVERHCGIRMRHNPVTSKIELIAMRSIDDISSLIVLDKSNVIDVLEYSKPSLDILNTEIRAQYLDRSANYSSRHAVSHNIGTMNNRRIRSVVDADYPYFTRASLAQWAADRDLLSMSDDITTARVKVNRDAMMLNVGDAVRFSPPEIGDYERVYRVREVSMGSLNDNGIELDLIEDIFGRGLTISTAADMIGGDWSDDQPPRDASGVVLVELPKEFWEYHATVFVDSPSDPTGQLGYHLAMNISGEWGYVSDVEELNDFSGHYLLNSSATPSDTTLSVIADDVSDFNFFTDAERRSGGGLCLLHDASMQLQEFISYDGFDVMPDGSITLNNVWRGLFDTLPLSHSSGTRLISMEEDFIPLTSLSAGSTYQLKPLVRATGGQMTLADAGIQEITISNRYELPNCPEWATIVDDANGDMLFTFRRRASDYSDIIPAAEVVESGSVLVEIYDASDDALLHSEEVSNSSTWTWTSEIVQTGTDGNGDPIYSARYPDTYAVIRGWDGVDVSMQQLTVTHTRI